MKVRRLSCYALLATLTCGAQTVKQFVATVESLQPETAEIQIAPDAGEPVNVKVSSTTIAQRIAPGERDLKRAATITVGEIAPGDRVLVALEPGTTDLRRIVVMAAAEISKRDEADRQDWLKRGVAGVVRKKKGNAIAISVRGGTGEQSLTLVATDKTSFRRYWSDSIAFADAKTSSIGEIAVGDRSAHAVKKTATVPRSRPKTLFSGHFRRAWG